ncbi:hypothetical protein [Vibrio parahaemolyticus]|uniref:hypothetical protein n=1 Tax=Vibrio parahaemolyticus TaxID=670 RepID=UPI00215CD141|nr:hypothetical protein [Vibrio parahaemolyticus]
MKKYHVCFLIPPFDPQAGRYKFIFRLFMKHVDLLKMFRQNKVEIVILREVRKNYFQIEVNAEILISKRGGRRELKIETAKKYLEQLGCEKFVVLLKDENNEEVNLLGRS